MTAVHVPGLPGPDDDERGAGTVLLVSAVALLMVVALTVLGLGAAQRARSQAQTAADLAALGAATAIQTGYDPCSVAGGLVSRNGAILLTCQPRDGGNVLVETRRPVSGLAFGLGRSANGRALAGPKPNG